VLPPSPPRALGGLGVWACGPTVSPKATASLAVGLVEGESPSRPRHQNAAKPGQPLRGGTGLQALSDAVSCL
jgi:hypothetical protein